MAAEVSEEFQRHVSALIVVQDIYPELMKKMIENKYPSSTIVEKFKTGIGQKLINELSSKQKKIVQSINTTGYREADTELMYKIIRDFGLVEIPSYGWGTNPRPNDTNQGDDIERMRHNRNAIVHRPRLSLTENEYNKFFAESMQIAQRVDVGKPSPVFQTKIENVKHLTLSSDMGDTYLANSPEFQGIAPLKNMRNLKIYFEMDIGKEVEINKDENESTECFLYVRDPEMNNISEIVRQLEEAIDHINSGRYKIKLLSVKEGSLIIHVTVVNQTLKEIKLLYEAVILLFSYIFDLNFVHTNCGQHIDVVLTKSDYTIFEENIHEIEPDTSEPDFKPMDLLQMNIAVHNSSFRSEQTLHGEIRGFVNTILNTVDEGTSNRNGSSIDVVMIRNHKETEKPSQPIGPLKISDVYKTEAKLSWEQRENEDELPITEYIIEYRETGEFAYTEVEKVMPNLTTFQLTGLKEDEEYFVQVKAVNNIGQSKPLEASFKTQRSNHVPSKPKNFQVKEKTSTAVTLQWQEPISDGGLPIKLYSIERKENALGQWGNKEKINATSTEFTVKGLLEGVEYFFRIYAENDIGASDPVDLPDVIQLTKELCNVYGADRNVTQEQENFYRHSTVIVDETKDSFLYLLDFYLANQGVTLHRFIEKYEHEIYHLCYNHYPCCQCPPGTRTGTRGSSVLHPPQLNIFLDKTGSKLPGHNPRSTSAPHCCCPVNPYLQLHDLDFTLARLLLVNFTTLVPQGSLERNALDFLVNSRNKSFAHAKEGKIDNNEYKKAMTDIEKQLLVLARVYGKEAETKQRLRDITKQPFNAAICQQLHNTLLQQCRIEETINRLLIERTIPEYLTKDLEDVRVLEGCDARFELWTREIDVKVEWFNGDTKIEESDKFVVESRGQIHRLVVTKADLKDRGIYASDMSGVKRIARLDIEEYFTNNMKSTLKCTEGDNIELSCAVLEDNVTAQWEKDGVGVQQSDKYNIKDEGKYHKLSIIHINPQDAGNYSVKISNRIRSTTVQVQEYFTKPLDTKTCIEGSNVYFDCEVLEDNQTALWFKNDTEISTSHRYKEESHGKLHRLVVYQTKLDDRGEYSVQIKNCVRRSELIIQEYFTKNMKKKVECIEGGKVYLSCEVLDADAPVEWTKDGVILEKGLKYEMQVLGKIHTLSIDEAALQDTGDYAVKINNIMRLTSLQVKEYFTKNLNINVEFIEGDKVNLSCEVLDDDATSEWAKDGAVLQKCGKYDMKILGKTHTLSIVAAELLDEGVYTVTINNRMRSTTIELKEIPAIIRQMSDRDKSLYLEIIKSATTARFNIQIVITGEYGVGKTCLLRRLLGETLEDVTKTDMIDIDRCKIRLHDGKWIIDKDTNNRKDRIKRIKMALYGKTLETSSNIQHNKNSILVSSEDVQNWPAPSEEGIQKEVHRKSIEKVITEAILNELSQFINDIEKYDIPNEVLVDCVFLDLDGQRHYYPTHPIFLNPNSVHLLVADILKDIKPISTEGGYDKIGEYIDFWFDGIHSCAAAEAKMNFTGNYLNPPVILVCTGTDKCKDKLEEQKKKFRQQLILMLRNEEKQQHLRRICWVSNTEPTDKDLDHLRKSIFEFGKKIGTFGDKLPLKWIRLEQILDIVREAGVHILSWSDIIDLSSICAIKDENEVSLFLRYYHKVGRNIYFQSLKEPIILNQKWLANAFSYFLSEKYDNDLKLTKEWGTLEETGELKPNLIENLLQKERELEFYKHQNYLLKFMEMFGIIVKVTTLIRDGKTKSLPTYYMPCMISGNTSIAQIFYMFGVQNDACTQTPWLCIQFEFMPFDFFNHILCHYVRKYPVCAEAVSGRNAIYHGMGVFFLDEFRKFVLCFSKNTVALQIWQWKKLKPGNCHVMLEELKSVIHTVKNTYKPRKFLYTVKTKCSNGNVHIVDGRVSYTDLINQEREEYFCREHNVSHETRDIFQTWFEHYSMNDDSNLGKMLIGIHHQRFNQKCHDCDREPSVFWCHICQSSMCQDCNNQHMESEDTKDHIVQHVQDIYSLDNNFTVNVMWMKDIKILHDGLLVIAVDNCKQLLTCHITGQQQNTILLSHCPYRLGVVDNNKVAVTLFGTTTLVIVDVREKQVIQHIDVQVECRGIMYKNNQLFLGCRDSTIRIRDMEGEVTRTIPVGVVPMDICSCEGGRICYNDHNKLYFIDTKGNALFTFTDRDMREPLGITTDDEGHVLVICNQSNNVLRISPDGTHSQVIITKLPPSYDWPHICYDSMSKSIVFSRVDNVYIYKKV